MVFKLELLKSELALLIEIHIVSQCLLNLVDLLEGAGDSCVVLLSDDNGEVLVLSLKSIHFRHKVFQAANPSCQIFVLFASGFKVIIDDCNK